MPLLKGKKNIGHNIAVEMAAGKPHKQSIAIALSVQKKNKKKMAVGGPVEATKERMVDINHQDMPRRKVDEHGQDIDLRDEKHVTEDDMMDSREMSMAKKMQSPHKQDLDLRDEKHVNEDDMHDDRDLDMVKKPVGHLEPINAKKEHMVSADDDEFDDRSKKMLKGSIADRVIQRKKFAEGGEVDLKSSSRESKNVEDDLSFDALRKENYSEDSAMDDLDYDTSRSVGHDLPDEDEHDMISLIRRKMKSQGKL